MSGEDAADYEEQEVVCQDMSLLPFVVKQAQFLDEGFMQDTKQLVLLSEAILNTFSDSNRELA